MNLAPLPVLSQSPDSNASPKAAHPVDHPIPAEAQLRRLQSSDDEARDDFVRRHARGTFFHLSAWRRSVEQIFGHQPYEWCLEREGRLVGILPSMCTRSLSGKRSLVSMPYGVYGGPLGESSDMERALVETASQEARKRGFARVELRLREDPGLGLARSDLYATFLRDLPGDAAQVLAGMPKKSRAEARKAREKHGLVLREGSWYLGDLVRLFAANKHGLGSPSLPGHWFQTLQSNFPKDAFVHVVQKGSEPLSAVMSFRFERDLLAYYAGTREGADREFSASNFMYMALQEWAVERGFGRFDFGRSRKDSGAFQFKEHQGFVAQDLPYGFVLLGKSQLPSFHPSNPRTKSLREAWTRLPAPMAGWLSGHLSRYLP